MPPASLINICEKFPEFWRFGFAGPVQLGNLENIGQDRSPDRSLPGNINRN
jgi:hypothetical protein